MLFESSTSDLKKKHPDRTFFSCVVAPTNTSKYFAAIVVFYKKAIEMSGSAAYGNHFEDCIVYGRRKSDDVCEPFGQIEEIYQGSSTYLTLLQDNDLIMLNAVSNTKTKIGTCSHITKEMKQVFRVMSPEITRGKIELANMIEIIKNYDELINKQSELLFVKYNGLQGVVSMKTGEELLPTVFSTIAMSGDLLMCYIGEDRFDISIKNIDIFYLRKYIIAAIFLNN